MAGGKALRGTLGSRVLEELIFCAGWRTQLPHYYFSAYAKEIKEEGHYRRAVLNMFIRKRVLMLWRGREIQNCKAGIYVWKIRCSSVCEI